MAEWKKRSKKNDEVIYFPSVSDEHALSASVVYIWDVDKTYLDTKFETFRGLIRTATEKATQKKNIPGAAKLVQNIKEAWIKKNNSPHFPIYFITASPPQMEKKIREKLSMDGVKPFGIFCKDNLPNLRPRRFWRLNKHVGYKLQALLQMRSLLKEDVRLILFGDDGESDSVIYSLFSDICSRRLDSSELRKILNAFHVLDDQIDNMYRILENLPVNDPVEKIYINLVEDTDAEYYLKFGRRTLPTSNSLQIALDLCQDHRLEPIHVVTVAQDLISQYGYTTEEIERSFDDMVRRQKIGESLCRELIPIFKEKNLFSSGYQPSMKPKAVNESVDGAVISLEGAFEPWVPERIDYLNDYR